MKRGKMYASAIGMIDNASYATQQNSAAIISAASSANESSDTSALQSSEKSLSMDNLNNQLAYNATSAMEDSQQKAKDEEIKRSFSMFG
jgi:hypothetical protein